MTRRMKNMTFYELRFSKWTKSSFKRFLEIQTQTQLDSVDMSLIIKNHRLILTTSNYVV